MVVYDGPAAAIRDALALLTEPAGAGPRLGLQIAEVPRTGPIVDGPGVEGAVRLAERAMPGQLLVSPAVRDLVAGSPPVARGRRRSRLSSVLAHGLPLRRNSGDQARSGRRGRRPGW